MQFEATEFRRAVRATFLGTSAFVAIVATTQAAQAQEKSTTEAESSPVGEILVTARRVEERLQDVPQTITVYNQDDLSKRNVAIATDLATYTPSLSVNQRFGPEKASFAIRGFNQIQDSAPTVGMYFAEVVGVRAQGGTTSGNTVGAGAFTDLANVQVLKGPQGTLFGRNTTGGAIMLTPQKPTDSFDGYIEGTYGNYDQVRLGGALNVPLADTFKVRLTVERNKRDGYLKNHATTGPRDFNDVNYFYARLGILADLTPDLENYTLAHYSHSRTNGYASHIDTCSNSVPTPGQTGYNGLNFLQVLSCRDQLARQTARGDGPYDVENSLADARTNFDQWQIINTTTWQASDTLTVKNIVSYGEIREKLRLSYLSTNFTIPNYNGEGGFNLTNFLNPAIRRPNGSDYIVPVGTPYQLFLSGSAGPGTYAAQESTFTEELQIQGHTADDRFNYVVGGYLEFSRPLGFSALTSSNYLNCADLESLACTNPLTFGAFTSPRTKLSFDNHGIFGQGTYKLTDNLSLTAGARWTFDAINGINQTSRFSFSSAAGSYIDPVSGISIRRLCSDSVTFGASKVIQDVSECSTRKSVKSNKPTWTANLAYAVTPDLMIYGKYDRGYRQGGIKFASIGFETWGPESMDSFEVGAKASFRGAVSGFFNVSAYYNKLKDMQVLAQLIPTPASTLAGLSAASAILNAGEARSYGLEIDSSLLFFDSLRISVGYTYLDTKVIKVASSADLAPALVGTPFASANPQVAAGTGFLDTPKHKLSVSASYRMPLDPALGNLSIGTTWTYVSDTVTNYSDPLYVNGFPVGLTPSYSLINANIDWKEIAGSPVSLSLFVTNLTKEVVRIPNQFPFAFSGGAVHSGYMQPRMYGLRLRYDLGK